MGYCLFSYFFGWIRDKEDKTFQWNVTWEVALEIWDLGRCPLETSDRVKVWLCVGRLVYQSCDWPLWCWFMEKYQSGMAFSSRAIFCMILVMGLEWSFGKTGGVERLLLLIDILTCLDFIGIRMPVWLSLCCPPMVSSFEMWDSLGVCMLGILRLCLTSW